MTKLILSVIVVVGTAFVLIFRRWGTQDARKEKLLKELADVVEQMEKMVEYGSVADSDFAHWHKLHNKRMRINGKLNRLNR